MPSTESAGIAAATTTTTTTTTESTAATSAMVGAAVGWLVAARPRAHIDHAGSLTQRRSNACLDARVGPASTPILPTDPFVQAAAIADHRPNLSPGPALQLISISVFRTASARRITVAP